MTTPQQELDRLAEYIARNNSVAPVSASLVRDPVQSAIDWIQTLRDEIDSDINYYYCDCCDGDD